MGRVPVPTPCVISPFNSSPSSRPGYPGCPTCRKLMDEYFFMNECHGVPLNTVIDGPSSPELNDIADRPVCHFDKKRPYTGTTIGSLCAMPCHLNHPQPFPSSFVLFPTTILLGFVSSPITLHSILNGCDMVYCLYVASRLRAGGGNGTDPGVRPRAAMTRTCQG